MERKTLFDIHTQAGSRIPIADLALFTCAYLQSIVIHSSLLPLFPTITFQVSQQISSYQKKKHFSTHFYKKNTYEELHVDRGKGETGNPHTAKNTDRGKEKKAVLKL